MGAEKNRLIETVLLSTHNICFGWELKKIIFQYALLSGGLYYLLLYEIMFRWSSSKHVTFSKILVFVSAENVTKHKMSHHMDFPRTQAGCIICLVARKSDFVACEQQRHRPAWASVQCDQRLYYSHSGEYDSWLCYMPNFNIPAVSLCSWASGIEAYLVRNPEDRFSHLTAYESPFWFLCVWKKISFTFGTLIQRFI